MPKKNPILRVRKTEGQRLLDLWLIGRDGAAEFCIMHGQLCSNHASDVMEFFEGLDVKVEMEDRKGAKGH